MTALLILIGFYAAGITVVWFATMLAYYDRLNPSEAAFSDDKLANGEQP